MKNRYILGGLIVLLGVLLWTQRIISINQDNPTTYNYRLNQSISLDQVTLVPKDAYYLSAQDVMSRFQISGELFESSDVQNSKYILLQSKVVNHSKDDMEWKDVFSEFGSGFETKTWAGQSFSALASKINILKTDKLYAGQEQDIWFVSQVDPGCFKKRTWERLNVSMFRYVLRLEPEKIVIKLG